MHHLLTNTYLEPGALTGTGLLLDRHNLEHLILQLWSQEEVNDLELLLKEQCAR